jgi:hypothetical protein
MKNTIDMARESGFWLDGANQAMPMWVVKPEELKAFEALVRADEREACAKVCDGESNNFGGVAEGPFVTDFGKHTHMSMAAGAQNCAAAIRARENT